MATIIDFKTQKILYHKEIEPNIDYVNKIYQMNKFELITEMIQFQERRKDVDILTPSMISEGIILFEILEREAETDHLRCLCRSYLKCLNDELQEIG